MFSTWSISHFINCQERSCEFWKWTVWNKKKRNQYLSSKNEKRFTRLICCSMNYFFYKIWINVKIIFKKKKFSNQEGEESLNYLLYLGEKKSWILLSLIEEISYIFLQKQNPFIFISFLLCFNFFLFLFLFIFNFNFIFYFF